MAQHEVDDANPFPDPGRKEDFPAFLESEAVRVATGMAAFREEWMSRVGDNRGRGSSKGGPTVGANPLRTGSGLPPENTTPDFPLGFSPFYYYPFLFAQAFPSLQTETLRSIALANRVLLEAILLLDKHMDESGNWSPEDFFLVDACYHRAIARFLPIFPPQHPFWLETENLYFEYGRAILMEQVRHRSHLSSYDDREFYEIATGKTALLRTTLLAFSLLTGDRGPLTPLVESQNRFLAGFQAFDDLKDWREDLRQRNFTQLLTTVLRRGGFTAQVWRGELPATRQVGLTLYYGGVAEEQLDRSEGLLCESLGWVRGIRVPMWQEVVRGFLKNCQAMRRDLAEIRRRETARASRPAETTPDRGEREDSCPAGRPDAAAGVPDVATIGKAILAAIGYLADSWHSAGGFAPSGSLYPYLNPSWPLPASAAITGLALRALKPLRHLDARLTPLFSGLAAGTDRRPPRVPARLSFPRSLEDSLCQTAAGGEELLRLDERFSPQDCLPAQGLFWANLLALAADSGVTLPGVEAAACSSIRAALPGHWTRSPAQTPGHPVAPGPAAGPAVSRPLLPLLLFCQALGRKLLEPDLRDPMQDCLVCRCRIDGSWGNPTDTGLGLLCLSAIGYAGPELASAAGKLLRSQEQNGSWPPNALFEQDGHYFGSRDLTTAWAALALFLHSLGQTAETGAEPGPEPRRPASPIPVLLHPGLVESLRSRAQEAAARCRGVLQLPGPPELEVYLGRWQGMPAHFLLAADGLRIGINLQDSASDACLTTGHRPVETEVALALTSAARYLARGPLCDRLEHIFVSGLGLSLSEHLWPGFPSWQHAGMVEMDWLWCREHETHLWRELRGFLEQPRPKQARFRWLLPHWRPTRSNPIPPGAALYLGRELASGSAPGGNGSRTLALLLRSPRADIVRSFRRKAGLDHGRSRPVGE